MITEFKKMEQFLTIPHKFLIVKNKKDSKAIGLYEFDKIEPHEVSGDDRDMAVYKVNIRAGGIDPSYTNTVKYLSPNFEYYEFWGVDTIDDIPMDIQLLLVTGEF